MLKLHNPKHTAKMGKRWFRYIALLIHKTYYRFATLDTFDTFKSKRRNEYSDIRILVVVDIPTFYTHR